MLSLLFCLCGEFGDAVTPFSFVSTFLFVEALVFLQIFSCEDSLEFSAMVNPLFRFIHG